MAKQRRTGPILRTWLSLDILSIVAASVFLLLIIMGVFPRVPW